MAKRKAGVTTRDFDRAHIELKRLRTKLDPHLDIITGAQKKNLNLKLKIVKDICVLLKLAAFRPRKSRAKAKR